MVFFATLYVAGPLLFKSTYTCGDNCFFKYGSLSLDGSVINKLRLKRSVNHVTVEEALRIKNDSSVLVTKLIILGTEAHKILHHLPWWEGDILLKVLTAYNTALEQFINLIKHDNINTRADVEKFLGQPHPNIAETDHLEWDARTKFNWADSHYKQFEGLMHTARQLWIELIYIHAYY